jgi:hypothetical protein
MKVAVLIAHTSSGWKFLQAGDDVGAIKSKFKEMKVAGSAKIAGEVVDTIILMDSGGNVRRKGLDDPDTVAARQRSSAAESAREKREAAFKADVEAKQLAAKAGQAAVAAVKQVITESACPDTPAATVPTTATPVLPQQDDPTEENHFGVGARPRRR